MSPIDTNPIAAGCGLLSFYAAFKTTGNMEISDFRPQFVQTNWELGIKLAPTLKNIFELGICNSVLFLELGLYDQKMTDVMI